MAKARAIFVGFTWYRDCSVNVALIVAVKFTLRKKKENHISHFSFNTIFHPSSLYFLNPFFLILRLLLDHSSLLLISFFFNVLVSSHGTMDQT